MPNFVPKTSITTDGEGIKGVRDDKGIWHFPSFEARNVKIAHEMYQVFIMHNPSLWTKLPNINEVELIVFEFEERE